MAGTLPVARVAVDIALAHLDRPFDYLVPERLAQRATAGCRVRVRFAGQLVGGYLLERVTSSEHPGRLAALQRVVSHEPVLSPEIATLAREVADRYAGTMADVLRLAIPPRHARAEAAAPRPEPGHRAPDDPPAGSVTPRGEPGDRPAATPRGEPGDRPAATPRDGPGDLPAAPPPPPGPWARYAAGEAFLAALADGKAPRAVWSALPGSHWPGEIARAAAATAAGGRGTLIVVPAGRDLDQIDAALGDVLGPGRHVTLAADLGPAERYRRWLAVRRGAARVVAGTRSAMFAPVSDLGLVVIWDDGDDLHAEPRAPYPHAREVLALRAHRLGAAALIGGFARTAEATSLVASGWAVAVTAPRHVVRDHAPQVQATGADAELARDEAARSARLPSLALRTARDGLSRGPVLIQVPRRGYVVAIGCERCRERARCRTCGGPLALEQAGGAVRCRWCGTGDAAWRCSRCGHPRVRALMTGAGRTAEELGRAFPAVPMLTSGGAETIPAVPASPALVVATPGAEPGAEGGYAAAVLLDGWVLLGRPGLRAAEEALRRWMNAAALVVPAAAGGAVAIVADAGFPTVQALVRWDPVTHSERELSERTELRFPPAVRMASVTGPAEGVRALLDAASLPGQAEVLGPVPGGYASPDSPPGAPGDPAEQVRMLVRVPRPAGPALARALHDAQAVRSARKDAGGVRVQLDPPELI